MPVQAAFCRVTKEEISKCTEVPFYQTDQLDSHSFIMRKVLLSLLPLKTNVLFWAISEPSVCKTRPLLEYFDGDPA